MSSNRLLSLAAGVNPELASDPLAHLSAAANAGWAASGLWYDQESWTAKTTRAVKQRLDDLELVPVDMEVIRIGPQGDHGDAMIDIAGELGVSNLLAISLFDDPVQTAERLAELSERAAQVNLRICLEFMRFTPVRNLQDALGIVSMADHPNTGILIDLLHVVRSGTTFEEIANASAQLFPYAQWCDAPFQPSGWSDPEIITDALDARSAPGEGELNVLDFEALFDVAVPFSLEVRSRALREAFPDFTERARQLLTTTQRALTGSG